MSDELTNDAIAQLLIDARRTSYTLRPGGEKRVTMTLACVDLLCHEVLRLRQEVATLRAERDAAVAEAVKAEQFRIVGVVGRWLAPLDMCLPLSLVRDIRRGE